MWTMVPATPQLRYTLPIFLLLSFAGFYFIVLQMGLSHAPDRFLEVHKASKVPLSLTHDRLPLVDKILTPLISFFVAAFGDPRSSAYPTVVDFVWSFGAAVQLPLLEAQRDGRSQSVSMTRSLMERLSVKALSQPMLWAIFYQRVSGGWILPLWLLFFLHSPVTRSTCASGAISSRNAESVLFGWWAGHTIPAVVMLLGGLPGMPAMTRAPLWVAFPILMSVAQKVYLLARRLLSNQEEESREERAYVYVQLLFLSALVGSAIAHVHLVILPGLAPPPVSPFSSPASSAETTSLALALFDKLCGLLRHLYLFYVPPTGLRTPKSEETTAASGVTHFVQWDVIVVFAAMWIAVLWDLVLRQRSAAATAVPPFCTAASNVTQASESQKDFSDACEVVVDKADCSSTALWTAKVFAGLFVTSLFLGCGTATAGLLMYREAVMKSARRQTVRQARMTAGKYTDGKVDDVVLEKGN